MPTTDPSRRPRGIVRGFLALVFGVVAGLVLGEVALRIHNPVEVRIKESEIRLPVNKSIVYRNPGSTKLDAQITCTRNILGFRGSNPPKDFDEHLTMVAVGGSATDCRFLSDGKTWPDRLGGRLAEKFEKVWLNNAGMDGQSTLGHIILLKQVLLELHPDYLIFLVGVNDVGRSDLNRRDVRFIGARTPMGRMVDASELLSTARVVLRSRQARERQLDHVFDLDLTKLEARQFAEDEVERRLEHARGQKAVFAYRGRLNQIISMARDVGIEPILVTQPTLLGEGIDPTTGVELGPLEYGVITSSQMGKIIEIYNDVTRSLARAHGTLVIDLARELPKDSAYYYDWIHYTNEGAEKIADILSHELEGFLTSRGHTRKGSVAAPRVTS